MNLSIKGSYLVHFQPTVFTFLIIPHYKKRRSLFSSDFNVITYRLPYHFESDEALAIFRVIHCHPGKYCGSVAATVTVGWILRKKCYIDQCSTEH
jgi:hypothetical protein